MAEFLDKFGGFLDQLDKENAHGVAIAPGHDAVDRSSSTRRAAWPHPPAHMKMARCPCALFGSPSARGGSRSEPGQVRGMPTPLTGTVTALPSSTNDGNRSGLSVWMGTTLFARILLTRSATFAIGA